MLSDDELTGLDEFALLAENAEQAGVNGHCLKSSGSKREPSARCAGAALRRG
ncbi:hypothetical protein HX91_2948 [Mycobacterium tuberculosis]|nr:hypothetical protein HX91_2948 [Mycobacterium tuberculosis]